MTENCFTTMKLIKYSQFHKYFKTMWTICLLVNLGSSVSSYQKLHIISIVLFLPAIVRTGIFSRHQELAEKLGVGALEKLLSVIFIWLLAAMVYFRESQRGSNFRSSFAKSLDTRMDSLRVSNPPFLFVWELLEWLWFSFGLSSCKYTVAFVSDFLKKNRISWTGLAAKRSIFSGNKLLFPWEKYAELCPNWNVTTS